MDEGTMIVEVRWRAACRSAALEMEALVRSNVTGSGMWLACSWAMGHSQREAKMLPIAVWAALSSCWWMSGREATSVTTMNADGHQRHWISMSCWSKKTARCSMIGWMPADEGLENLCARHKGVMASPSTSTVEWLGGSSHNKPMRMPSASECTCWNESSSGGHATLVSARAKSSASTGVHGLVGA